MLESGAGGGIDLLIGTTSDEARLWLVPTGRVMKLKWPMRTRLTTPRRICFSSRGPLRWGICEPRTDMHRAWVDFASTGSPGWAACDERCPVKTFDGGSNSVVFAPHDDERTAMTQHRRALSCSYDCLLWRKLLG